MNREDSVAHRVELIFEESKRVLLCAVPTAALYIVVMVGVAIVVDVNQLSSGGDILIGVLNLALGFMLVKAMVENSGLAPNGIRNGFWVYFGLGLLTGIAVVVGLILFIIPGLVLLIRWSPIYGYAFAEGADVSGAMSKAWEATGGHFWPLAITVLAPLVFMAAALGLFLFYSDTMGNVTLPVSVIGNLLIYSTTVISTAIGLAIYSLLANPDQGVAEVFD